MDIRDAKCLGIGHHLRLHGWEIAAHHHPFHEIIIVTKGSQSVEAAGETCQAGQGDVLLFTAGLAHHEWSLPDTQLESYFASFALVGLDPNRLLRATDPHGRIRQLAHWLHADRTAADTLAAALRDVLLQAILGEFFRDRANEENELVVYIRNYVRTHIAESLSLDVLARQARMSKFHFVRAFRAACGRTPMEEVRRMRADYARDLILSSGLPFKEIAPRAGLGNEYAMCRTFRQLFNQTPGEFRRFGATPGKFTGTSAERKGQV